MPKKKITRSPNPKKHKRQKPIPEPLNEKEQLLAGLEFQARKLAFLLYASTMPESIKQSWLTVLPEMSLEQVQRFLDILEAKYLNEQTRASDKKFEAKLKQVFAKFAKQDKQRDEKLIKQIKQLTKKIK